MNAETITGKIKELYCYPEKKAPGVCVETMQLIAGKGIYGDCHCDGKDRQVALLTAAQKEWMQQEKSGFCFQKYKENILFEGFSLADCAGYERICIGEAVLQITEETKKCYPQLCPLAGRKPDCILAGCRIFATVLRGGEIRKGMEVTVKQKKNASCNV